MKRFLPLFALLLVLAACDHEGHDDDMMDDSKDTDSIIQELIDAEDDPVEDAPDGEEAAAGEGVYTAFSADVIGNGEDAVLFFHASWCPTCVANDKKLESWYPSDEFVSTYKIDYDTAGDLKEKYGVLQQDTYVRIDGAGMLVDSASFPSEKALTALVSK